MNRQLKRLVALGVLTALMATGLSLTSGPALADDIDTTITVENTSCTDATPSSVSLGSSTVAFPTRDPQLPATAFRNSGNINVGLYVNECLEGGWAVTASATDFHSGTNSFSSASHLQAHHNANQGSCSTAGGDVGSWCDGDFYPFNLIPQTDAVALGTSWSAFTSQGDNNSVLTIGSGTTATGNLYLGIQLRLASLPNTLPGGDYEATFKLTFTPGGP